MSHDTTNFLPTNIADVYRCQISLGEVGTCLYHVIAFLEIYWLYLLINQSKSHDGKNFRLLHVNYDVNEF